MKLTELFDRQTDWIWTQEGFTDVAHTSINNKDVEIRFGKIPRDRSVYVAFYVDEDAGISGRGDQFAIFGSVVECIVKYIHSHPVELLWFTADLDEPKRVKLYDAMCARLVKKIPYSLTVEPSKTVRKYVFTKDY